MLCLKFKKTALRKETLPPTSLFIMRYIGSDRYFELADYFNNSPLYRLIYSLREFLENESYKKFG